MRYRKPMEKRLLRVAPLQGHEQVAKRMTDRPSLGLPPWNPLLDPRHIEMPNNCRAGFVTNQVAIAQPHAGIRVVTQFHVQHDNRPVPTSPQILTDSPGNQQELVRGEWSSNSIAKAHAVPLGISDSRDGPQNVEEPWIKALILPGDTPTIERAQAREVVALVGSVFHAMLKERASNPFRQVRPPGQRLFT